MTEQDLIAKVTSSGAGLWRVEVLRAHGGKKASGHVVVRSAEQPAAESSPRQLAAARAWRELGLAWQSEKDAAAAIACAESGLHELGEDYAPKGTEDDTDMKLLAAQERIKDGHMADGAAVYLRMLESRVRLYQLRHQDTIVE